MQPFPSSRPERVLVRAVNWLGDAVLTTPALGALRAACPQARITGVAEALGAGLVPGHPPIDGRAADGRRLLLSPPVPVTEEILSLHHAEYYLRLLAELGVPRTEAPRLLLRVTEEERRSMRSRLARRGGPQGGGAVGGH